MIALPHPTVYLKTIRGVTENLVFSLVKLSLAFSTEVTAALADSQNLDG